MVRPSFGRVVTEDRQSTKCAEIVVAYNFRAIDLSYSVPYAPESSPLHHLFVSTAALESVALPDLLFT